MSIKRGGGLLKSLRIMVIRRTKQYQLKKIVLFYKNSNTLFLDETLWEKQFLKMYKLTRKIINGIKAFLFKG